MSEPVWLTEQQVLTTHADQLARFGGPPGVRDPGALSSALNRPKNRWAYQRADLPNLAAAYCYGIAKNHPFVDGNKRVAFLAMMGFLWLNGIRFEPEPHEATAMVLAVAAGEVDETGLARWIRDNWPEVDTGP